MSLMAAMMNDLANGRMQPTTAREITKAGTLMLNTYVQTQKALAAAALQQQKVAGAASPDAAKDERGGTPKRRGFRLIA